VLASAVPSTAVLATARRTSSIVRAATTSRAVNV
jgi:hypothetical protein